MYQMQEQPLLTILNTYQTWLAEGRIDADEAQAKAVDLCYHLQQQLIAWHRASPRLLQPLISLCTKAKPAPKGLYLYGQVGRGKSMIMDLFFDTAPLLKKRRVHFHAFMQEIHSKLHDLQKKQPNLQNPLAILAKEMSQTLQLLCFDEFHINDITDAMLIGPLFEALFKHRIIIVATSNVAPNDLYKDGLQRQHLIPFIILLKNQVTTFELQSPTDYRLRHLSHLDSIYLTPHNDRHYFQLQANFEELTNGATAVTTHLHVKGRELSFYPSHGAIAMVTFEELCGRALGAVDYIEIAQSFDTLIVSNIPYFTTDNVNETKRFILLIDELYEHKVKLICSAADTPDHLCQNHKTAFEFQRTASRLMEMQSPYYLALPKTSR